MTYVDGIANENDSQRSTLALVINMTHVLQKYHVHGLFSGSPDVHGLFSGSPDVHGLFSLRQKCNRVLQKYHTDFRPTTSVLHHSSYDGERNRTFVHAREQNENTGSDRHADGAPVGKRGILRAEIAHQ